MHNLILPDIDMLQGFTIYEIEKLKFGSDDRLLQSPLPTVKFCASCGLKVVNISQNCVCGFNFRVTLHIKFRNLFKYIFVLGAANSI